MLRALYAELVVSLFRAITLQLHYVLGLTYRASLTRSDGIVMIVVIVFVDNKLRCWTWTSRWGAV